MAVPIGGGTVTQLAATNGYYAGALAIDSSFVYWVECGSNTACQIKRVPLAGGSLVILVSNLYMAFGLAVEP